MKAEGTYPVMTLLHDQSATITSPLEWRKQGYPSPFKTFIELCMPAAHEIETMP
jgi:hypothetical protein